MFFKLYTLSFSFQQLLVVSKFICGDIIPELAQVPIFFSTGSSGLLVTTYINRTVLRFIENALKDIQTIKNVFFVQIYHCQRDRHVLQLNVPVYLNQV